MSLLPKQPDTLISEFAWSDKLTPCQLLTNPFFLERLFCSDLSNKESKLQFSAKFPVLSDTFHDAWNKLADFTRECQIIKYSITQYKLLKGEFTSIEKEYHESLKIIEYCFQVANAYWDIIKKYLIENSFSKSDHEIYFFKVIKPAFISEGDFLSLAYHALLFNKSTEKDITFWEREKQRKDRLLLDHSDFFTSYLNGHTEKDEVWFTRTVQLDQCSHDHIVSSWFAVKRYESFIESAILQSNKLNNW